MIEKTPNNQAIRIIDTQSCQSMVEYAAELGEGLEVEIYIFQ